MAGRSDDQQPPATSADLLVRAREGDSRAISALFSRQGMALRRWAAGRLPRWARTMNDTADLVQDALMQTLRRIDRFEDRGKGALQAYLRQAVYNRIRDEVRRVGRRPTDELDDQRTQMAADDPSPFDLRLDAEQEEHYRHALTTITDEDRLLVVGRMELHYTYEQLALISGRATPEAARLAVRRAILKLANAIPHA